MDNKPMTPNGSFGNSKRVRGLFPHQEEHKGERMFVLYHRTKIVFGDYQAARDYSRHYKINDPVIVMFEAVCK